MSGRRERFIVDAMLGNIVTWLRILGYDTIYWSGDDGELIKRAREENRIILTMDRELALNAIRNGLDTLHLEERFIRGSRRAGQEIWDKAEIRSG